MKSALAQDAGRRTSSTLWRSGAHPLPVDFPIFKVFGDAELPSIVIWFNPMRYDKFAGEASTTFFIKSCNGRRYSIDPELADCLIDSECKLPIQNRRPKRLIVVEIEFAKAGVKTPNNIFIVLVDDHGGGAEDHEVEVEDCH